MFSCVALLLCLFFYESDERSCAVSCLERLVRLLAWEDLVFVRFVRVRSVTFHGSTRLHACICSIQWFGRTVSFGWSTHVCSIACTLVCISSTFSSGVGTDFPGRDRMVVLRRFPCMGPTHLSLSLRAGLARAICFDGWCTWFFLATSWEFDHHT